jgi:hypothetical protein
MSTNTQATSSLPTTPQRPRRTKLTFVEEATVDFEAYLRANGGLVPLTADGPVTSTPAAPCAEKREEKPLSEIAWTPDVAFTPQEFGEFLAAVYLLGRAIVTKDLQQACERWERMSPLYQQIITSETGQTLLAQFEIHKDLWKGDDREGKARD